MSNPRAFPSRDEELVAARRVTILIYRKKHTEKREKVDSSATPLRRRRDGLGNVLFPRLFRNWMRTLPRKKERRWNVGRSHRYASLLKVSSSLVQLGTCFVWLEKRRTLRRESWLDGKENWEAVVASREEDGCAPLMLIKKYPRLGNAFLVPSCTPTNSSSSSSFFDLVKLVGRDQGGFSIAPAFGCVTPQDFFRIRRSAPFALETWQPPNSAYRFKLVSHKGSRTLSFLVVRKKKFQPDCVVGNIIEGSVVDGACGAALLGGACCSHVRHTPQRRSSINESANESGPCSHYLALLEAIPASPSCVLERKRVTSFFFFTWPLAEKFRWKLTTELVVFRTFGAGWADGAGAPRGHVLPRGKRWTSVDAFGAIVSTSFGRPLPHRRQQSGTNPLSPFFCCCYFIWLKTGAKNSSSGSFGASGTRIGGSQRCRRSSVPPVADVDQRRRPRRFPYGSGSCKSSPFQFSFDVVLFFFVLNRMWKASAWKTWVVRCWRGSSTPLTTLSFMSRAFPIFEAPFFIIS